MGDTRRSLFELGKSYTEAVIRRTIGPTEFEIYEYGRGRNKVGINFIVLENYETDQEYSFILVSKDQFKCIHVG